MRVSFACFFKIGKNRACLNDSENVSVKREIKVMGSRAQMARLAFDRGLNSKGKQRMDMDLNSTMSLSPSGRCWMNLTVAVPLSLYLR